MVHTEQTVELLNQTINQKKLLFKQLTADLDFLNWEIEQLEHEQKTATSKSAALVLEKFSVSA